MKRDVVRRAFANFSGLEPSLIPEIGPTLASPLQYAYRTKLTPHFQTPPTGPGRNNKKKKKGKQAEEATAAAAPVEDEPKKEWEVTIGFEQKGRKRIVDIEECVIATKVINDALTGEREKVKRYVVYAIFSWPPQTSSPDPRRHPPQQHLRIQTRRYDPLAGLVAPTTCRRRGQGVAVRPVDRAARLHHGSPRDGPRAGRRQRV